jgi:hypothetical protein
MNDTHRQVSVPLHLVTSQLKMIGLGYSLVIGHMPSIQEALGLIPASQNNDNNNNNNNNKTVPTIIYPF